MLLHIYQSIFSSKDIWIVDTVATKHFCFAANAFVNTRIIDGSNVNLPNQTQIPVRLCGDVKLSQNPTLRDVLFVL